MANPGLFRLYARVAILGFWGVLFGLGAIVVAAAALGSMNGEESTSNSLLGQITLAPLLLAGFNGLLEAGAASIGLGVVLLILGVRLSFSGPGV